MPICFIKSSIAKGGKVFLNSKRGCHHWQINQRTTLVSLFEISRNFAVLFLALQNLINVKS